MASSSTDKSERLYCVKTFSGIIQHLPEWFIKLSRPLMRLTSLIPLNSSIVPNPTPARLPSGITSTTLDVIVIWCSNHRTLSKKGQEWRQWEYNFFKENKNKIFSIKNAARILKINALKQSLNRRKWESKLYEERDEQEIIPTSSVTTEAFTYPQVGTVRRPLEAQRRVKDKYTAVAMQKWVAQKILSGGGGSAKEKVRGNKSGYCPPGLSRLSNMSME